MKKGNKQRIQLAEFKSDSRFKISNKEALIGVVLAILNFLWWYGFGYGMGGKPVEAYNYILGLPAWFFYSCVLGFLLFSFIVYITVKLFFVEVPFDVEEEEEGERQ